MALEIFKLFGSVFIDNSKADESLSKTEKKADKTAGSLLKGVGTAAKWGAGIAGAAVAGATALGGIAMKATDTAGAIDDVTNRVGVSAEEWQKYAYAAKLSGIEQNKLEGVMKKSQTSFTNASTGNKKMAETYKELGLNIKNIKPEDSFDATVNALAKMEDTTKRNALANKIFGKSYADLNPLLNSGAKGIKDMKDEAVKVGAVMSNQSVAAGAKFGDTVDKLKMAAGGLFNKLGTAAIPILQKFADVIVNNMPMIQGMIAQASPIIIGVFSSLIPPLMSLGQSLMPTLFSLFKAIIPVIMQVIGSVLPVLTQLLKTLLPPIVQIVKSLLPPLLSIVKALLPVFKTVISLLTPIIKLFLNLLKPIVDIIAKAITPLIKVLASLINSVLKPIMPIIKAVADVFGKVLLAQFKAIEPVIKNIKGIFKGLTDFISGVFTGNWKKAFNGLSSIIKNVFAGMMNIVKAPINFIIKGLNAFIGGINKIKIPDWVPGVGGKGLNLSKIPMLATGGNIVGAGRVLVGEKGPEFLDLPKGARVTPLDKANNQPNQISLSMELKIDTFNNNRDFDIEKLSDDLAFQVKRKLEGSGIYEYNAV